jgi:hypothetical protein
MLTLGGCLWICAIVPTLAATPNPTATDDIFSTGYVGRLQIQISEQGMSSLRKNSRTYVRATVHEEAIIYTNVAVHLKGGLGSFQNVDEKPSFTLNFSKFAEGQTFRGFKKIHLNSSKQDSTFLNEKISRDLFNAAGVPMARATHAFVELNGEDLGLHVMIEGFNKQFFKRHFKNASGNLYEGGYGKDVSPRLPVNEGDDRTNHSGMKALIAAAREPDRELRRVKLEQALDVVPGLATMPVARTWAGLRPATADGLPVVGPWPGLAGLVVATGHYRSGILLAPVTARLVRDLVVDGHTDLPASAWRPDRLAR